MMNAGHEFNPVAVSVADDISLQDSLARISELASGYLNHLHTKIKRGSLPPRLGLIGQLRSSSPSVALQTFVKPIAERLHNNLRSPFEASHLVAGAELPLASVLEPTHNDGCLWLRFAPNAVDLPMHVHEHSHRFIIVIKGSGRFQTSQQSLADFTGTDIHTTVARPADVLIFPKGTVHTFSTSAGELLLLSYHSPFVPLSSSVQYTLPTNVVCPANFLKPSKPEMACDAVWTRLT